MLMPASMRMSSYAERVILQIWKTSSFSSTKSTPGCQTKSRPRTQHSTGQALSSQLYYTPYLATPTPHGNVTLHLSTPHLNLLMSQPAQIRRTSTCLRRIHLDMPYPRFGVITVGPEYKDDFDCGSESHPKTSSSNCQLDNFSSPLPVHQDQQGADQREGKRVERNNPERLFIYLGESEENVIQGRILLGRTFWGSMAI